ncbi:MAG: hypothetical protein PVG25_07325 [Anaerolineae bacterium]
MSKMMRIPAMLRSLGLIAALLAAGIPASAQLHAPSAPGAVHAPRLTRLEHTRELVNDSADEYDHYLFLPLVHASPYPLHPPQIEPPVGEHFPCSESCDTGCTNGVSNWLLVEYDIEYGRWGDASSCPLGDVEPGDPVIEVTARIRNDSDVDYWTWATGTSYDAEGDFVTGTIRCYPTPFPNTQLVHAHETGDFTFHLKSHRAIAVIRVSTLCASVWPPP